MKRFVISLVVALVANSAYGVIYFPDTKPSIYTESVYSENNVKGKEIYSVNVHPKQLYYAFVSEEDITIVNCPGVIQEIVVGGQDIIQTNWKKNGHYFTLKAIDGGKAKEATLQVICEGNFTALLLVKIVPKTLANKVIHLYDARDPASKEYTKEHFDYLNDYFEKKLSERDEVLKHTFFRELKKYPINQSFKIKDSKMELENITFTNTTLFFNFIFLGDDEVKLNQENIYLYYTPFNNFVLTEQSYATQFYNPKHILIYEEEVGKQFVTLSFEIPQNERKDTFYFKAHVTNSLIFEGKVDLALLGVQNKNLFDIRVE